MLTKTYFIIQNRRPHIRGFLNSFLYYWLYKEIYYALKVWSKTCIMHKHKITFKKNITIPFGCFISPLSLSVAKNRWLGVNAFICGKVVIATNITIGPNLVIPCTEHVIKGNNNIMVNLLIIIRTIIKDGVWFVGNAVILDVFSIGEGAVIGANSNVTKDVPAYSICLGNPACVIKSRCGYNHV